MHDRRHVSWRQSDIPVTGEAEYGEADHEGTHLARHFCQDDILNIHQGLEAFDIDRIGSLF